MKKSRLLQKETEMKERRWTKEVWLTSLILFPHSAGFQIDLHTAQCPCSLGLAGWMHWSVQRKKKLREMWMRVGGEKTPEKSLNCNMKGVPSIPKLVWLCEKRILLNICDSLNNLVWKKFAPAQLWATSYHQNVNKLKVANANMLTFSFVVSLGRHWAKC